MLLPDDAELCIIDNSNYDEVVYEGKHEDMEIPLKYYHSYWVKKVYPGRITVLCLRGV